MHEIPGCIRIEGDRGIVDYWNRVQLLPRDRFVLLQQKGEEDAELEQVILGLILLEPLEHGSGFRILSLHERNLCQVEASGKESRFHLKRLQAEFSPLLEVSLLDGDCAEDVQRNWRLLEAR